MKTEVDEMSHGTKMIALSIAAVLALTLPGGSAAQEEEGSGNPRVYVSTNLGTFEIELYPDKAPVTVSNFLNYVEKEYYDGTIFHRVIPDFMIQGGGFTKDMIKKETAPPIKNEATNGLSNEKYTIAMARTGVIDSATSQFFINVKDNPGLDHRGDSPREYGYAVFGKVVEGQDVVDKIKGVKTTTKGNYRDVPVKPVIIKAIRLIEEE